MSNMVLREISREDLPTAQALLAEGFSRRSTDYWAKALGLLAARPQVEGYPHIGFLLEVEGTAQGVILLISAQRADGVRSNLSSWYVREDYRKYAAFMFQRTIRIKGGIYLNLSPSAVALPIAQAFGFKPYSGGTLAIDPRAALKRGEGRVRGLSDADLADMTPTLRGSIQTHVQGGCRALTLEDATGTMVALYQGERFKRILPTARFVYGDPARLAAAAGPLARYLLKQGKVMTLLDRPETLSAVGTGQTVLAARGIRYFKGAQPPVVGDLLGTEVALFGA